MTTTLDRPAAPVATPPAGRPSLTLLVVCLTTALLMLDIAVVNTALPSIARDLRTGLGGVQWVVDGYTLALAAAVLTAGSLADRFGRRRLLLVGLAVFTTASTACAASSTIGALETARAVQGIGAAVLFAVSLAVLGHAYQDSSDRAKALAAYGATIGASFAVGPLVGGLLTETLNWRWIFLVNVPIGLLCLVITLRSVEESRDPQPRKVDVAGLVVMSGALFLLVFGLVRSGADGWGSSTVVLSLAAAAVLLIAFVVLERSAPEPMVPLELFRDRLFTGTQVAAFAISSSLFALFVYATIYLQGVLHLSPIQAGAAYLPGTVVMFVAAGATAQLLERLPAGAALCGSLLVVAAGMVLMLPVDEHSSWWAVVPGTVVAFAGAGVFNPVMSGLVLSQSAAGRAGLATGINDSFRQTGIALGVAFLGTFIPSEAAFGGDGAGYVHGLHIAIGASIVIAVAGAAVAGALVRPRRA